MNEAMPVREGADIFSTDMIHLELESKIVSVFENSTILITGSTGYLGKMFLEKLLRICPKLRRIYLLLRPKKGKDVEKRFEEIFDGPNMEPMKRKNRNYLQQVSIINGDCSEPDLGLDISDKQKLIDEVNFVIHCAATVRFDEKLKRATHINVRAVLDLINIAKQMKNLKGYLHVSTAFSNCNQKIIEEKFYKPVLSAQKLIQLVDILDEDKLDVVAPSLFEEFPNSYVFTKNIAEDVIKTEAKSLPIAVLRPSIVVASINEPVAGWIDNFYGATGVLVGAALGLLKSLHGNKKNLAEVIPADYCINSGLAVLWEVACKKALNENVEIKETSDVNDNNEEIQIYNVVSSSESPLTWEKFESYGRLHGPNVPSEHQVWHYFFALRTNRIHHLIAVFLLHTIPAYVVDLLCYCIGKKPMMVKGYQKIHKFMDVLAYFSINEWKFTNENVKHLWKKLEEEDKRLFQFSMANYDWDYYFHVYTRGARVYLLKDPLETIPKGKIKYWKLFFAHYTLMAILFFFLYKLSCLVFNCLF